MPRKTDSISIKCPFLDKRTKLLPCQKERILGLYIEGASITALGKMFQVNKRLVQFILFPERRIKNVQDRKERIGNTLEAYGKEYFAEQMKKHRQHKKDLFAKPKTN
jgi:hypothetical protein